MDDPDRGETWHHEFLQSGSTSEIYKALAKA
jgi:hypothetical protein